MRRIIRRREVCVDDWRYPGEPGAGPQVVKLAELPAGGQGVELQPEEPVEALAPYLPRLRLVVLRFPKIGEGRGYSQARLLRERLGYSGELRAAGALKRDQLQLLARCGCDSFDLDPAEDLVAALPHLDVHGAAYLSARNR